MKKKPVSNVTAAAKRERLDSSLTVTVSAIGSNLVAAATNCLADQAYFCDGVIRFEMIAARRISTSYNVPVGSLEGEDWEVWEFEVFPHTK
jgi:hypothetical protein